MERCRKHAGDLAFIIQQQKLSDAKEQWLCTSFKDLQEEMALHSWEEV